MQKILSLNRSLVTLPLFALLVGCATAPKLVSEKKEGTWSSSIQITDKKKSKTQSIDAEIFAVANQKLRLELSGLLSTPVASILIEGSQFQAAVHVQKRAFSGAANPEALEKAFGVEIDPFLFYSFYFDFSPRGSGWRCIGESGMIKECRHDRLKQSLIWKDRNGENKTVVFETVNFLLEMKVRNFQPIVQSPEKVFKMNIPKSYSNTQL